MEVAVHAGIVEMYLTIIIIHGRVCTYMVGFVML